MSGRTTVSSDKFNNWWKWRNSSLTVLVSPSHLPRFASCRAPLSRAPRNRLKRRRIAKVVKPHYTETADAHESLGLEPINYRALSSAIAPHTHVQVHTCSVHTFRRKTETIARCRTMSMFSAAPRARSQVTAMYIGETRISSAWEIANAGGESARVGTEKWIRTFDES